MRTPSNTWAAAGMIVVLVGCVAVARQERPASAPGVPQVPQAPAALDPAIDKILSRLESRKVHDLSAKVTWRSRSPMEQESDARVKLGTIKYKDFDPVPKFRVEFDKRISNRTTRPIEETHVFDGRWYVEIHGPPQKTVHRREIRRASDPLNPFKLGEKGAFPLPFGQKKEDILREFEVTRNPSLAGLGEKEGHAPPKTDHIRLTPRANTTSARSYNWVDFWIAQDGPLKGLPVKVLTAKKDVTGRLNAYVTITFDEVKLDTGFSGNVFDVKAPRGYHEETEPLPPLP